MARERSGVVLMTREQPGGTTSPFSTTRLSLQILNTLLRNVAAWGPVESPTKKK